MVKNTKNTKKASSSKKADSQSKSHRLSAKGFFTKKYVLIPILVLALLFATAFIYYKPARIWYREARKERVLREQLIAVRAYNDQLSEEIKSLETTEGIEDYATSQLSLVHEGDNVVVVTQDGEPLKPESDSRAQRIEGLAVSSEPFGVWTDFFDALFGIE